MSELIQVNSKIVSLLEEILEKDYKKKDLAKYIMRQSDIYNKGSEPTEWHDEELILAQYFYYLPLNNVRAKKTMIEALKLNFFDGLDSVIELGPGLGALTIELRSFFTNYSALEKSEKPKELLKLVIPDLNVNWINNLNRFNPSTTLFATSYSLNELDQLPKKALDCEAILLIEPSTRSYGRRLLQIRSQLIENGFFIWAPCTHQSECPLLKNSKKDWCHDRAHTDLPNWFLEIEKKLKMKNKTVTFSYLLARRKPPNIPSKKMARIIGDPLIEKGKTRQLICQSSEREFLCWMKKHHNTAGLVRGDTFSIPDEWSKVSNEIRVPKI